MGKGGVWSFVRFNGMFPFPLRRIQLELLFAARFNDLNAVALCQNMHFVALIAIFRA